MRRRAFLGFLGGAAVSAPTVAKAAADNITLRQAGFPTGDTIGCAAPLSPVDMSQGGISRVVKWIRRAGIPPWKMNDLRRQADFSRQHGLDPDLAALRSVSGGWKAREQRRRNLERVIDASLASIGRNSARRAYEEKMQSKFGEYIEWYD